MVVQILVLTHLFSSSASAFLLMLVVELFVAVVALVVVVVRLVVMGALGDFLSVSCISSGK